MEANVWGFLRDRARLIGWLFVACAIPGALLLTAGASPVVVLTLVFLGSAVAAWRANPAMLINNTHPRVGPLPVRSARAVQPLAKRPRGLMELVLELALGKRDERFLVHERVFDGGVGEVRSSADEELLLAGQRDDDEPLAEHDFKQVRFVRMGGGQGVLAGAKLGALIGTFISPGVGTSIGGALGVILSGAGAQMAGGQWRRLRGSEISQVVLTQTVELSGNLLVVPIPWIFLPRHVGQVVEELEDSRLAWFRVGLIEVFGGSAWLQVGGIESRAYSIVKGNMPRDSVEIFTRGRSEVRAIGFSVGFGGEFEPQELESDGQAVTIWPRLTEEIPLTTARLPASVVEEFPRVAEELEGGGSAEVIALGESLVEEAPQKRVSPYISFGDNKTQTTPKILGEALRYGTPLIVGAFGFLLGTGAVGHGWLRAAILFAAVFLNHWWFGVSRKK